MPFHRFATLVLGVIAAAGATLALAHAAGLPFGAFALVALLASAALVLRRGR
jgi:hypothetical protein